MIALPTAADTRDFGRRLAAILRAGDLVVLSGPLGAGKTALVQGIGAGLGVQGNVVSPTFVIARVHRGPTAARARRRLPARLVGRGRRSRSRRLDRRRSDGRRVGRRARSSSLPTRGWRSRSSAPTESEQRTVRLVPHGGDWAERIAPACRRRRLAHRAGSRARHLVGGSFCRARRGVRRSRRAGRRAPDDQRARARRVPRPDDRGLPGATRTPNRATCTPSSRAPAPARSPDCASGSSPRRSWPRRSASPRTASARSTASRCPARALLVATDARRREVYWAAYRGDGAGRAAREPPRRRARSTGSRRWPAPARGCTPTSSACRWSAPTTRRVSALADRARDRIVARAPSDPLTPLYLRRPDAVEPGTAEAGEPMTVVPMTPTHVDLLMPYEREMFGAEAWTRERLPRRARRPRAPALRRRRRRRRRTARLGRRAGDRRDGRDPDRRRRAVRAAARARAAHARRALRRGDQPRRDRDVSRGARRQRRRRRSSMRPRDSSRSAAAAVTTATGRSMRW